MYQERYTAFKVDGETGKGEAFSTSNKKTLSDKTGIGYDNLVRVFTREKRVYCRFISGWEVVKSVLFFPGNRRGVGSKFK